MTFDEFYYKWYGKAVDVDGYYGSQCWDGAAQYMKELGYPVFNCTTTGYVKDIWNNRKSSGILKYFTEVQKPFKKGDIIIWNNCTACPYSHIAIFKQANKDGTFIAFGQNQGGANGAFNNVTFNYSGVLGGLRPKNLKESTSMAVSNYSIPSGFKAEAATFTVTVDALNVRDKASTSGTIVATYKKGQSVKYDCYKAEKNGYVWLSYIGASGKRRYVAAGKTNAAGVNTTPYGTFK